MWEKYDQYLVDGQDLSIAFLDLLQLPQEVPDWTPKRSQEIAQKSLDQRAVSSESISNKTQGQKLNYSKTASFRGNATRSNSLRRHNQALNKVLGKHTLPTLFPQKNGTKLKASNEIKNETHQNFDLARTSLVAHSFILYIFGWSSDSVGRALPTTWYWWNCAHVHPKTTLNNKSNHL